MYDLLEHFEKLKMHTKREKTLVENSIRRTATLPSQNFQLPVNIEKKNEWQIVTEDNTTKLKRTFKFSNKKNLLLFLNELLIYQDAIKHHGTQTIDDTNITIIIYTHDIDDVMQIDIEYSKYAEQLYKDINNE